MFYTERLENIWIFYWIQMILSIILLLSPPALETEGSRGKVSKMKTNSSNYSRGWAGCNTFALLIRIIGDSRSEPQLENEKSEMELKMKECLIQASIQ